MSAAATSLTRQSRKAKLKSKLSLIKRNFLKLPVYGRLAVILVVLVAFAGGAYHIYKATRPVSNTAAVYTVGKDSCASLNTAYQNSYSCYKKELTGLVDKYDPETATAFLKQQYSVVPYVKTDCHQLMHVVGRAAYAKYGDLAQAFAHGDQYCWSGFYHGIMEQVSIEKGYDYIFKNAASICKPIAAKYGEYSFNDYNCVHGLGHGFMEVQGGDLFASLKSCDAVGDDWDQSSCTGGVFMQNVMNVQGPEAQPLSSYKYLTASDPMYPCDAVDSKYQQSCYLMQTSFALQVDDYDFNRVFAQCADINADYIDTCYQSLGRDASGNSISDIYKTKATCLLGPNLNSQLNCTVGAVKDFVSYYHSDTKGYALCAAMPADITPTCNDTVKEYYATF